MAADADRLLALAEAISDGKAFDWAAAETDAVSDNERALVQELRLLAGVADAHRSPSDADTATDPGALEAAHWGGLELRERLGAGTYGVVYRAYDRRLAREVALKLLQSSDDLSGQAVEEGRLLARVSHPHVITVFGADKFDGRVGIWMELIRGATLETLLRERGPFSAREAASIGAELCGALAAVHRAGLVHRDVKAQNVMREAGGRLVLMDFGAGQELMPGASRGRIGTPLYMAPELFDGAEASPQSDIYSLGVLLFHIVTGDYPVVGATSTAVRDAHASGQRRRLIDLRPDLPRAFAQAVDLAIERDPAARYATAGAMEAALSHAFEPPKVRAAAPSFNTRRAMLALAGILVLAAGTALVPAVRRNVWQALFAPAVRTIVVVPFTNLSNDPAKDYFAAGVGDILMSRLAMIEGLRVIDRVSVLALSPDQRAPASLGSRLGAQYSLEGSVESQPGRVRISARLVEASTGTLLWADTTERPLGDMYQLQGEMAAAIGTTIVGRLSGTAQQRLRAPQTTSTEAQEAFLQARYLMYRFDRTRMPDARRLLERAVSLDPAFGAAQASLSRAYGFLLEYNMATAAEVQPLAMASASQAVTASPDLPEAQVAYADARFRYATDWDGADAAYRRARALAPHAGFVLSPYARFLSAAGRLDEALKLAEEGAAADPLSGEMVSSVGVVHYLRREYDEAIRSHEQALRVAPSYGPAYFGIARAYSGKGDYPRAIDFVKRAQAAVGDHASYRAELARNYVLAGYRDLADQTLGGLLLEEQQGGAASYEGIGFVYAALGNRDRAFEWLNRAMDHYFARMLFLKVDPRVDSLRDDPRFDKLLQRLNLQR
jgi:serine/threonine-protein kinase